MKQTCIKPRFYRLFLEKMVIGIQEPILVKGIGKLIAKIDSGNSGYNVLHGVDFVRQGDILNFKTLDADGNIRRVSKKIKSTISINIGGGHIQERPVVELDVQFGGEDYKKVLFSITDRSDNEHKVLISKDFVGKELEALIDVTKDNIADNNINVDYVTEGIVGNAVSAAKKASHVVGNLTDKVAGTSDNGGNQSWLARTAERWKKRGDAMVGKDSGTNSKIGLDPKLKKELNEIKTIRNTLDIDKNLIIKQMNGKVGQNICEILETENSYGKFQDKKVFCVSKLLDYTGNAYNPKNNPNPEFTQRLTTVIRNLEKKAESEGSFIHEATTVQPQQSQNNQQQTSTNNNEQTQYVDKKDLNKGLISNNDKDVIEELRKRNRTIFYLFEFLIGPNGEPLLQPSDLVKAIEQDLLNLFKKIDQGGNWGADAWRPHLSSIANKIKENAKGGFAICSGPDSNRQVIIFDKENELFNGAGEEAAAAAAEAERENKFAAMKEEAIAKYNELNKKFKETFETDVDLNENSFKHYMAIKLLDIYNNIIKTITNNSELMEFIRTRNKRYNGLYPSLNSNKASIEQLEVLNTEGVDEK